MGRALPLFEDPNANGLNDVAVAVALPEVVDPEPLKPPASVLVVVNASHLLSPLLK